MATPAKIANTTICRISLVAMASMTDFGTRWVTNSLSVRPEVLRLGEDAGVGDRETEVHAGLENVDHQHAEQERDQRGGDEPSHGLGPDAPER